MNPVKATALYTNVCRCALLCETHTGSGTDLHRLLPSFRQSVCCLVCGNLLQDPIAPINSSCQHYVCKGCKGHGMVVMPPCGWCQDNGQFAENRQLCILVECYRKLCEFIARSPSLARHVSGCPEVLAALQESPDSDPDEVEEEEGTCQPARANGLTVCNRLCQEKRAGTETSFAVTLVCEEHPVDVCGHDEGVNPAGAPLLISVEEVLQDLDGPPRQHRKRSRSEGDGEKVLPLPIGPIVHRECPEGETPPLKAPGSPARKSGCKAKSRVSKWRDGVKDPRTSPLPPARLAPRKPVAKKGCKCGRATQNPSVLTCRGQRCPCYSGRKACLDCVCRGCQNSYMANGEKKLGAFAVPEKALEQTRLTLGIGVTGTAPNGTVPPVTANALTRSWT